MYYTYILYSEQYDRYYIGHCEDLPKRIMRHNNGMVLSTKKYLPWIIVYTETYNTRKEANTRELYIKRMKSRKFIESLILKSK